MAWLIAVCLTASPGGQVDRLHLFYSQAGDAAANDDINSGLRAHLQDRLPAYMMPAA